MVVTRRRWRHCDNEEMTGPMTINQQRRHVKHSHHQLSGAGRVKASWEREDAMKIAHIGSLGYLVMNLVIHKFCVKVGDTLVMISVNHRIW